MAGKKRWVSLGVFDGIWTVQLASWEYFYNFLHERMLNYSHYVWRGDRCDNRPLLPSFDRKHTGARTEIEKQLEDHLETFKQATRGRRGMLPAELKDDNDWWALGQHHGLDTPLLDWSHSAFVALFFAFEKVKEESQTPNRVVYAICPNSCKYISNRIKNKQCSDIVEFFSPQQDENDRLVNQNGLFSRCTAGKPLENWIQEHFKDQKDSAVLVKLLIPTIGRDECLRTLNKMNINYLTLFPDLSGASNHSNNVSLIDQY